MDFGNAYMVNKKLAELISIERQNNMLLNKLLKLHQTKEQ